jgi:peptidyl-tRNA hydrolase, PTH1 family
MHLVVGLGNPGSEYVGTRHNVGWEVLDALANSLGWIKKPGDFERLARGKFDAITLDGNVSGEKVLMLKPMTYMNLSGSAVRQAMAFYQLVPADLMVVLDDLALPSGRIRIRSSGSSGGHNGLKDIERALGTDAYPRLRLGIDSPPGRMAGKDYVLAGFTAAQRELIDPAVAKAAQAVVTWIESGIDAAMNKFNQSEAG